MSLKTLLVTPAGKEKIWDVPGRNPPETVRAEDAFTGRFARRCAQYARIHYPKDWVILSPNYGYLLPDQEVRNHTTDEFGAYSLEFDTIKENAEYDGLLDYECVIFLGSEDRYGAFIETVKKTFTKSWIEFPLRDAESDGEMLGILVDSLTRRAPLRRNVIRLARVKVDGLFGALDHDIPLFPEDSLSIITAPNGYGKTTVLRILRAIFMGNVDELRDLPFESVRLDFLREGTPGGATDVLTIAKEQVARYPLRVDMHFRYTGAGGIDRTYTIPGGEYAREEVSAALSAIIPPVPVKYISAQRLWYEKVPAGGEGGDLLGSAEPGEGSSYALTVVAYAEDIKKRIQALLSDYASIAQELDATYPARYLAALGPDAHVLPPEDIGLSLACLQEERRMFETLGFLPYTRLEGEEVIQADLIPDDAAVRQAIALYIADSREKYQIFGALKKKIDLLQQIINDLFLHINLTVDIESGFLLRFGGTTPVPATSLSSGEQHQLVMYYDLIFQTDPGTLVLIDEPEISLHVVWQRQFLECIREIISIADADFILATHSPQLIHTSWDHTIDLSGTRNDER